MPSKTLAHHTGPYISIQCTLRSVLALYRSSTVAAKKGRRSRERGSTGELSSCTTVAGNNRINCEKEHEEKELEKTLCKVELWIEHKTRNERLLYIPPEFDCIASSFSLALTRSLKLGLMRRKHVVKTSH